MRFRQAAVLGAGVMGAQIAAHFANAGLRVRLLDVTREAARDGLERAKRLKPDPFFTPGAATLIETGGFDDDLAAVKDADWILEAIVEKLDAKQALLARVDAVRRADAVVSSNTSGIPIASIAEGRSDAFRRHWLGTHFFNPPRYLHLLELIPTPETDPAVVRDWRRSPTCAWGRAWSWRRTCPVSSPTGSACSASCRPSVPSSPASSRSRKWTPLPARRSAGRRARRSGRWTLPVSTCSRTWRGRSAFELPAVRRREMVARGMTGAKAGRGFYQKAGDEILTLDSRTLEFRPKQSAKLPSLEAARPIEPVGARIQRAVREQGQGRRVAARHARPDDRVTRSRSRTRSPTRRMTSTRRCAGASAGSWGRSRRSLRSASTPKLQLPTPQCPTPSPKPRAPSLLVRKNAGASLIDIGDGVLQVEFHSKMNAIGGDTIQMLHAGVKEASQNFAALVVGNDAANFSAGANLMLLLLEAQEGNWDEVELMVRGFQGATMALKYADVPVVVAPARAGAWRRLRDRAARRARAGGGRDLHRPRRSRRRPDPRRRRHQGDAGARDGGGRRRPIRCPPCSACSRRSASRR